MSFAFSTETLAVLAGAISAAATSGFVQGLVEKRRKTKETLEDRISTLSTALGESSRLVSEIEREISARQDLVVQLQQDAARYQALATLSKEQVDALIQSLGGELRREGMRSLWINVGVTFVFFLLGALMSWLLAK